jgi:hypothetical protein
MKFFFFFAVLLWQINQMCFNRGAGIVMYVRMPPNLRSKMRSKDIV